MTEFEIDRVRSILTTGGNAVILLIYVWFLFFRGELNQGEAVRRLCASVAALVAWNGLIIWLLWPGGGMS